MTNKKIELQLRTIELAYNESRPFHPLEEAMLERYTRLHNFVGELCQEYTDVQTKYELHEHHVKKVIVRFSNIKARLARLAGNAKNTVNLMVPSKKEIVSILAEATEFKSQLTDFHHEVERLSTESSAMHRYFQPLENKDERLSEIFMEYKEYRSQLDGMAGRYSLDLEKYSNDEQHFIVSVNDMNKRQTEFIGVCNRVIDRYNHLIEGVEKVYAQWEDYGKIIDMLKLIQVTPYETDHICLN